MESSQKVEATFTQKRITGPAKSGFALATSKPALISAVILGGAAAAYAKFGRGAELLENVKWGGVGAATGLLGGSAYKWYMTPGKGGNA
jgi:hypothetical protein